MPTSKNIKTTKLNNSEHICEFCKKTFVKESSLIVHACEKKKRWMWRDEKHVKIGFIAYQRFYQLSFPGIKNKVKTYHDFMNSQYFGDFVKFGKYLQDINAIEQDGFINSLIKNSIKLNRWCDYSYYEAWIRELTRKESPYQAVERTILLTESWSRDTGEIWTDFFRKINVNLATKWIKSGRISPWILYSGFGEDLFSRMSDEQLSMIESLVDPVYWADKIKHNLDDVKHIQLILKESGM